MTRFANPVPKFTDENGDFLPYGLLYFYESGTLTDKATYADFNQTIPNTQPLVLNGDGSTPNCYYSGKAKVKLITNAGTAAAPVDGVQQWERDPVNASNLAAVAWGKYNFATDTLTNSFGCSIAKLSTGLATLTLSSALTSITSAISLTNSDSATIGFTTTTTAALGNNWGTGAGGGSGAINSGSTTDVITHIYGSALTINHIQVTPTSSLGSASYLYVSAVTANDFTIATDTDPLASTTFSTFLAVGNLAHDKTDLEFVIYDTGV